MAPLAELQQLDKKRAELVSELEELDHTILDLKQKRAEELLTEIKALGIEVPFPWGKKEKAEKKPTKAAGEKFCKTCETKGHDTRAHNRHPEKFTEDELAAKGWPTT